MELQSLPNKQSKVMEPAQKSDFCQLQLEHTQQHLSPTDMLQLFLLIICCLKSICDRAQENVP